MVSITVRARGIKETQEQLNIISGTLDEIIQKRLRELADDIIEEAVNNLAKHESIVSGELADSIRILSEGPKSVTLGTDLPYAGFVEFGRPEIRPVSKKVLHWIDPDTGEDVFSAFAAPTQPRPFLHPAISKKTKQFKDIKIQEG